MIRSFKPLVLPLVTAHATTFRVGSQPSEKDGIEGLPLSKKGLVYEIYEVTEEFKAQGFQKGQIVVKPKKASNDAVAIMPNREPGKVAGTFREQGNLQTFVPISTQRFGAEPEPKGYDFGTRELVYTDVDRSPKEQPIEPEKPSGTSWFAAQPRKEEGSETTADKIDKFFRNPST